MASDFFEIGREMMNRPTMKMGKGDANRRFNSFFGATPEVCNIAWDLILAEDNIPKGGRKEHMMWALRFLKTNETENVLAGILGGIDEKTLRKWIDIFVRRLSNLEGVVVSGIFMFISFFKFRYF